MKKLVLIAALALSSCCENSKMSNPRFLDATTRVGCPVIKLRKGNVFLFGYSNQIVSTFTVSDTNKDGVFVGDSYFLRYIPYHDLACGANFKLIR